MEAFAETGLEGAALDAWRSYLQSHASIVRVLDADLAAEHGMTTRDYEVLLYLSQAEGRPSPDVGTGREHEAHPVGDHPPR